MDSRSYPQGKSGVKSKYVSGVLEFYDTSGNVIFSIDPVNRKFTIPSGSTFEQQGTAALTGTQTFDDIVGNDASLGITGAAGAAGAVGGAVVVTGGVPASGNANGGAVSATGGAGSGTGAGGAASLVGGASGAGATGNGGAASVTGGAAASTNGNGGSVALTPGAKAGTGVAGIIRLIGAVGLKLSRATISNAGTVTVAQVRGGILYQDAGSGSVTMTSPTGAELAAEFADLATGEALPLFLSSNHGSNTSTIAGGDGVTVVGSGAVTQTGGTFLLVKTGASAFDAVRVG